MKLRWAACSLALVLVTVRHCVACTEGQLRPCVAGCKPVVDLLSPDLNKCDTWKCLIYCARHHSMECLEKAAEKCNAIIADKVLGAGMDCDANCDAAYQQSPLLVVVPSLLIAFRNAR